MQNNPNRVRWDVFLANPKGALPPRQSLVKIRQKPLPPVRSSNVTSKPNQSSIKSAALPPIDNTKKPSQNLPIVFILSKFFDSKNQHNKNSFLLGSSGSTKLCSRLMERYKEVTYLSIHDVANIDEDDRIGKTSLHKSKKISKIIFRS